MLFVIYAIDAPSTNDKRNECYQLHRDFLSNSLNWQINIVLSGPLVEDNETDIIGSLFIIDAPSKEVAIEFHHADPFYINKIWSVTTLTAFIRRR